MSAERLLTDIIGWWENNPEGEHIYRQAAQAAHVVLRLHDVDYWLFPGQRRLYSWFRRSQRGPPAADHPKTQQSQTGGRMPRPMVQPKTNSPADHYRQPPQNRKIRRLPERPLVCHLRLLALGPRFRRPKNEKRPKRTG